jgi:hypothetical protein
VATTVLLLDGSNGEFCLRQDLVALLARLGVTSVEVVCDRETVGIVLEGWMFDPERSAEAAARAVGPRAVTRLLRPVLHVAVARQAAEGG